MFFNFNERNCNIAYTIHTVCGLYYFYLVVAFYLLSVQDKPTQDLKKDNFIFTRAGTGRNTVSQIFIFQEQTIILL
jgi:hypothetical protein